MKEKTEDWRACWLDVLAMASGSDLPSTKQRGVRATARVAVVLVSIPAYIKLFEEAKRQSNEDFESSHELGERGVVIGPVEGNFRTACAEVSANWTADPSHPGQ